MANKRSFESTVLRLMSVLFLFTVKAHAVQPTAEESLNHCYASYPFFQEALMLISDNDFKNPIKSKERKEIIKKAAAKNISEVRICRDRVIQVAKKQNDLINLKYVVYRMTEVSAVIYVSKEKISPSGAK